MKLIILGAGATAYSEHANPDRRPPLSNEDLLRMFNKPAYHIRAIDASYNQFFSDALKLYDYNIEALFTGIYSLANRTSFFKDKKAFELKKLGSCINDIDDKKFLNILTFFQSKLLMEIQLCIGTKGEFPIQPYEMPICSWHRKIAKQLNSEDVVVSFNYDLIMPYALLNEKKLSTASFLNPYIKEVDIPKNLLSHTPVILITPHGSFTWYTREKLNYYDHMGKFNPSEQFFDVMSTIKNIDLANMSDVELANLNFKLDPTHMRVNLNNNLSIKYHLSKVILPLQKKKQVLENMPHFKEEYNLFLNKLEQANEIYLVGKNFKTSDKDIADDIEEICSKSAKKHIIYINPDTQYSEWINHHNKIFNAASHELYEDLPDYIHRKNL